MEVQLVVNVHRRDAVAAARAAVAWLRERGVDCLADHDSAPFLGVPAASTRNLGKADLMISFGGDGTLIRAADLCSLHGTPILGVAYGTFGFVTQCKGEDVEQVLTAFLAGDRVYDERMMLQAELIRKGASVVTVHAVNEVVAQRAAKTRMMVFRVVVDGVKLTSYPADGVLLATPTGSTAYSLSVGGPIVDPQLQAIVFSAIAPHTLSSRPLVFRPESVVELALLSEGDAVLSVDGHQRLHLMKGDAVRITRSPRVTRMLQVGAADFTTKLNALLFWGQSIWRELDRDETDT